MMRPFLLPRLQWSLIRKNRSSYSSLPVSSSSSSSSSSSGQKTLETASRCEKNIRVRFAPSPTGSLHIGGFRTALYNYLFAKSKLNGKFVLRIEDTDQTRLVSGAAEGLEEILRWTGIFPDESPSAGGPAGPYVQSQRLPLYLNEADRLLKSGLAYRCFCSERRLELLKKEAIRNRTCNRYDGRCANLSESKVEELIQSGTPHTVRLRLDLIGAAGSEEASAVFDDMVYGKVKPTNVLGEGDPILVKSDGFPVYHFANVVDDHHMGITHVLRGVEWQVSTPKHLLLYKALGWTPPCIGHLPLMVNLDGTKLSKRQQQQGQAKLGRRNRVLVEQLREDGFLPEALISFITASGGGFRDAETRDQAGDVLHSLTSLSNRFDLSAIKTHPTAVDFDRLDRLNRAAIKARFEDEAKRPEMARELRERIRKSCHQKDVQVEITPEQLEWLSDRLKAMSDVAGPDLAFVWIEPGQPSQTSSLTRHLAQVVSVLRSMKEHVHQDFSEAAIGKALKSVAVEEGVKVPDLMREIRLALSGIPVGPPVGEMVFLLGLDASVRRLEARLEAVVTKNASVDDEK